MHIQLNKVYRIITRTGINVLQIPPFPQFVLPHSRGSSHGQTRIIRKAYEEYFYTQMMQESYELWAQLEEEAGVELYR